METFEAIVSGQFALLLDMYMQAISDDDVEMPDAAVEVSIVELGLGEEALQQVLQVLYDIGFTEEQLQEDVRVTALGLICMICTRQEIAEAILWHNVYYKLGIVRNMAVVSVGAGEETDEVQSIEAILRARELDGLIDLQYNIYNNLPPF